jgi:hypothetical protein
MGIYEIRQAASGAILWTGGAESEEQALDAMAREAGYRDYASMPAEVRGGDARATRLTRI